MGVLISNNGSVTLPCLLLCAGVPLMALGRNRCTRDLDTLSCDWSTGNLANQPFQWTLGVACLVLCVTLLLIESGFLAHVRGAGRDQQDEDEVETELMATHYQTLEILEMTKKMAEHQIQINLGPDANSIANRKLSSQYQRKLIPCLNAIALKVSMVEKPKLAAKCKVHMDVKENELYLLGQEISFIALRSYPSNDLILSSALSLLALVSKKTYTRKRHLLRSEYSASLPIRLMQESLLRAKEIDACTSPQEEEVEHIAAELQRKGCLFLGALADGDVDLASNIVHNGGLSCILGALDWYQCHVEVVNWGLWATFNLCYDHLKNKGTFVQLDGIGKVIRAMNRILDLSIGNSVLKEDMNQSEDPKTCEEIAMHGIAILFDVLRLDPSNPNSINSPQLKRIALNAGIHSVLMKAMNKFSKNSNVMMMGQQLLLQTGYTEEIPCFDGTLARTRTQ